MPFAETYYNSDVYNHFELLSPEEQAAIKRLRPILDNDVKPYINEYWEKGEFPTQIIQPLVDGGFMNPTEVISAGAKPSGLYAGFRNFELARTDVSTATFYNAVSGLFRTTVLLGGSPEQAAEWDPQIADFKFTGVFCLTEAEHGSDIAGGLATSCRREGDTWVLNGDKRWIGGCSLVGNLAIFARDEADNKVKGFIVPTNTPGYKAEKIEGKYSLRIVQNAHITMTNVVIPDSHHLANANSFADTNKVLAATRLDVAWASIGNAIGAYDKAVAYATERQQFGKPIAQFQLVQDLLVKSLKSITAALAMVARVAELNDRGIFDEEQSSMAKLFAAGEGRKVVSWCRELLGGNGIVIDYDVIRHFADAESAYSYEGTEQVNTLIVGRAITGKQAFV